MALFGSRIKRLNFNPRSPCGERLTYTSKIFSLVALFQSTLPVRGAAAFSSGSMLPLIFQSTLPVRGAAVLQPPAA